jgi:hypothetical protein
MMGSNVDLTPRTALDGLPKAFVDSLRTLFDILDEDKTGSVSLQDIEGGAGSMGIWQAVAMDSLKFHPGS